MSHQSGIEPTEELKKLIARALQGSLRFLQVVIDGEELTAAEHMEPDGSWEEDFGELSTVLSDTSPCYIFYRLDDRNSHQNFLWVFMSFTPDNAQVRHKMLYAATKATIRKAFTSGVIIDDVYATSREELTLAGYRSHMESQKAAPPLTDSEIHLKELQENEDHADIGTSTRQSHLHGVAFPIAQDAKDALVELKGKRLMLVQLKVNTVDETILLDKTEADVHADSLPEYIPDGSPRYTFYVFKHSHEGDYDESIVFIYSCPGFKSSIKERMLYSSCKEPLISEAEHHLGLQVVKKVEIDDAKELSEAYLMDELHPQQMAYRQKFMRPPPPNRKRSRSPHRPGVNNNGTQ